MTDITAKLAEALERIAAIETSQESAYLDMATCQGIAACELADYRHHTEAQAGGTEGERRDRMLASLTKRAMGHPRVLEIMSDCAICADAEDGALSDEFDDSWLKLARELRTQSAAIIADDPELWDRDYPQARAALAADPAAAQGDVREQFEAHCHRDRQWSTERLAEAPDEYLWHVVASAWKTWQAAHESGRQQGVSQAKALWEMGNAGLDIDPKSTVGELATHVGAWETPEGLVCFGGWQAVAAMHHHILKGAAETWKQMEQAKAEMAKAEQAVPVAWTGGEEWEALAWALCAEECGDDACNDLIWEGGPVPEPWGDRWLKYEPEAKRMIALVRKHTSPPATERRPLTEAEAGVLQRIRNAISWLRDGKNIGHGVGLGDFITLEQWLTAGTTEQAKEQSNG